MPAGRLQSPPEFSLPDPATAPIQRKSKVEALSNGKDASGSYDASKDVKAQMKEAKSHGAAFDAFFDPYNVENKTMVDTKLMVSNLLGVDKDDPLIINHFAPAGLTATKLVAGNSMYMVQFLKGMLKVLDSKPVKAALQGQKSPMAVAKGNRKKSWLEYTDQYTVLRGKLVAHQKVFENLMDQPGADGKMEKKPEKQHQMSPIDAMRHRVVNLAMSQIGKVCENRPDHDQSSKSKGKSGTVRSGHAQLQEYFAAATNDASYGDEKTHNGDKAKYHRKAKRWRGAHNADGSKKMESGDALSEWCGLFVLWAFRAAGHQCGKWDGAAHTSAYKFGGFQQLGPKDEVKPGDVGVYNGGGTHHFIVAGVNGDQLLTIEGNTNSNASAVGGETGFLDSRVKQRAPVIGAKNADKHGKQFFRHNDFYDADHNHMPWEYLYVDRL